MNDIEVIGLGALNIDHIYQVERILEDGEAVVNESISSPGGSAANTIYGLAKLGVKTGFVGAVGGDAEGKILLQDFQEVSVDTSQIRIKRQAKTGSVICLSALSGKRSLHILPGANSLLTLNDLDSSYINQAKILHLSSFADEKQFKVSLELIDRLDLSTRISFSPGALYATKGLPALAPILGRTHLLCINQSEIQELTGQDFKAGAETCLKHGCNIVVVTLGKGTTYKNIKATSYIRDSGNEYILKPSPKKAISAADTTGAGDAFAAGFLYALLKGKGLEECGHLGDIVARFSITKMGARPGLPTLNELSQRYREFHNQEL